MTPFRHKYAKVSIVFDISENTLHFSTTAGTKFAPFFTRQNVSSLFLQAPVVPTDFDGVENRLTGVSGAESATFVYDGDGNRIKATVGPTTTYYFGDYYEIQGSTVRKYYYAGGRRVAMNENGTVYWLLSDHLGSTAITANSGGGKTGELRYYPFGSERYNWGNTPTTYRFTGQRSEEAGIGLYFYLARWYVPVLGRFVQADTIVPESGNPQAWDRYAYVFNNPLRYIDPSGHWTCEDVECKKGLNYGTENLIYRLPDDIPDYVSQETVDKFIELRLRLIIDYGYQYVTRSGRLDDQALTALIMQEFRIYGRSSEVYLESVEAASNQYYFQGYKYGCKGGCDTIPAQLLWMQDIEMFRGKSAQWILGTDNAWLADWDFAGWALDPTFQYGATRESWVWGNVDWDSQMAEWINAGQGSGSKYVVALGDYVVLTVDQNQAMRKNRWHAGTGPYWGR